MKKGLIDLIRDYGTACQEAGWYTRHLQDLQAELDPNAKKAEQELDKVLAKAELVFDDIRILFLGVS